MAFIIESSKEQSLIHIRAIENIEKADAIRMKICVGQLLAARPKHKTLYLVLDLEAATGQSSVPIVQLLSSFAEIYHQWRKDFHLELLLVLDPSLSSGLSYLCETLVIPLLSFTSQLALEAYIERKTSDTQTLRPANWAQTLKKHLNEE